MSFTDSLSSTLKYLPKDLSIGERAYDTTMAHEPNGSCSLRASFFRARLPTGEASSIESCLRFSYSCPRPVWVWNWQRRLTIIASSDGLHGEVRKWRKLGKHLCHIKSPRSSVGNTTKTVWCKPPWSKFGVSNLSTSITFWCELPEYSRFGWTTQIRFWTAPRLISHSPSTFPIAVIVGGWAYCNAAPFILLL